MEKIEVGEYIRTKDGVIAKVISKDEDNHLIIDRYYDGAKYLTDIEIKEKIKSHSFNIIDLIEEGDYVNGKEVSQVLKDKKGNITDVCYYEEAEEQMYSLGDIKSIVTKEQFKDMEYEVK